MIYREKEGTLLNSPLLLLCGYDEVDSSNSDLCCIRSARCPQSIHLEAAIGSTRGYEDWIGASCYRKQQVIGNGWVAWHAGYDLYCLDTRFLFRKQKYPSKAKKLSRLHAAAVFTPQHSDSVVCRRRQQSSRSYAEGINVIVILSCRNSYIYSIP